MDSYLIPPKPELHDLAVRAGNHRDGDFLMRRDTGYLDLAAEERDPPECVNFPALTQTEDVLGRGVGLEYREGAREGIAFGDGLGEA